MTDQSNNPSDNIALLIDADNASPEHLDDVLLVLGELGTVNIRRAYGNRTKASLKGWGELSGLAAIGVSLLGTAPSAPVVEAFEESERARAEAMAAAS